MAVTAKLVQELRTKTGAGMMDCKQALTESNGDLEKAIEVLRKKGLASAAKRAGRVASEGLVYAYIHAGGKIGVLVEVNSETDFVARTPQFQQMVKDIAMQIAASNPTYLKREDVPEDVLKKEREIYRAQMENSGKPEKVIEKIVEGKLDKFFSDVCLYEQPFVKEPAKTISQLVAETVAQLGENLTVRRFVRFVLGEGIEKVKKDLAEEIAAQIEAAKK